MDDDEMKARLDRYDAMFGEYKSRMDAIDAKIAEALQRWAAQEAAEESHAADDPTEETAPEGARADAATASDWRALLAAASARGVAIPDGADYPTAARAVAAAAVGSQRADALDARALAAVLAAMTPAAGWSGVAAQSGPAPVTTTSAGQSRAVDPMLTAVMGS